MAIGVLERLPEDGAALAVPLEALRTDPEAGVRSDAADLLARYPKDSVVAPLIDSAATDPDGNVRLSAIWSLESMAAKESIPALGHVARTDPESYVRKDATRAMARMRVEEARGLFQELAGDSDVEVRAAALYGLAGLGDEVAVLVLADEYEQALVGSPDEFEFRRETVEGLWVAGSPAAVPFFRQVMATETNVQPLQVAIWAELDLRDLGAVPFLDRLIESHPSAYVRQIAEFARRELEEVGPPH